MTPGTRISKGFLSALIGLGMVALALIAFTPGGGLFLNEHMVPGKLFLALNAPAMYFGLIGSAANLPDLAVMCIGAFLQWFVISYALLRIIQRLTPAGTAIFLVAMVVLLFGIVWAIANPNSSIGLLLSTFAGFIGYLVTTAVFFGGLVALLKHNGVVLTEQKNVA